MKSKNQKPIEINAFFKYVCQNPDCGFDHWLSFNECRTKGFKVVCDCGFVFKPKRISNIKISYCKDSKITKSNLSSPGVDLTSSCVKLLTRYSFTQKEALELVNKAFQEKPVDNPASLVKYIFQNLEKFNVYN